MAPECLPMDLIVKRVDGMVSGGLSEWDFRRMPRMRPDPKAIKLVSSQSSPGLGQGFSLCLACLTPILAERKVT